MDLFSELAQALKEHEAALIRYSARMLNDQESARDAVQDTFIKYAKFKGANSKAVISNVRAWLYKSARNICIDMLRKKKRGAEILLSEEMDCIPSEKDCQPDNLMRKNEESLMLRKLINKLGAKEREVLVLKIEHGSSYKEIAEITGLSVTNVGFILHSAMMKLKEEFHHNNNPCGREKE